jgi:hypothetical protein
MKLFDCVLIGLVCFVIVYILMLEINRRKDPFKSETESILAQVQAGEKFDNATEAALKLQMETYEDAAQKALEHQYEGMHGSRHTHELQSDIAKKMLNERNIGAPWYHPVASDPESDTFADAAGSGVGNNPDPSSPLKPDDLLPKDQNHGWTQQYLNCKDLLANKNFVDTDRFKFSNEVLDTRNTQYQSLDIRKTPIVSHNPVSIWQKSPVEKSVWEYVRPSLDD